MRSPAANWVSAHRTTALVRSASLWVWAPGFPKPHYKLNQDSGAVARAASLLELNEQEEAYLASCRKVKGIGSTALLLADGERTPLMISTPPRIRR